MKTGWLLFDDVVLTGVKKSAVQRAYDCSDADIVPVRLQTPKEVLAEAEKCRDCWETGHRGICPTKAHTGMSMEIYNGEVRWRCFACDRLTTKYILCPTCIGSAYKLTEAVRWALEMKGEGRWKAHRPVVQNTASGGNQFAFVRSAKPPRPLKSRG